jgi:hypothetical protein
VAFIAGIGFIVALAWSDGRSRLGRGLEEGHYGKRLIALQGGLANVCEANTGDCGRIGEAMEMYIQDRVDESKELLEETRAIERGEASWSRDDAFDNKYAPIAERLATCMTECDREPRVMAALRASGFYRPIGGVNQ